MKVIERTFRSWDGTDLFYRAWLPEAPPARGVMLFHRGHEHSGRWEQTVKDLQLTETAAFAWDQRGHGRSPGERGAAESLAAVVRDAEAFAQHLVAEYDIPLGQMAVVAHSVGAVVAAAWVHDYAPPIRCLVLAAPAFRVKLYVPLAIPLLRLKQAVFGPGYIKSYVKAKMLTHDAEQAAAYNRDELISRQIAVNILLDLFDVSARLLADAGAITAPTLILAAGSDWVVTTGAQQRFFDRLGSGEKRFERLQGFSHAIFHEKDRHLVVQKVRSFIDGCFSKAQETSGLLNCDRSGYTRSEYDRLCGRGGMRWSILRAAMKTVCRLSKGVSIGWSAGFDSGVMLDYIYENKPQGTTPLGVLIDRNYLNAIGWRGIRQRKINLQSLLKTTAQQLHGDGKPVHILDIASGPGRYVLETMKALGDVPMSATLRDYKEENLEAARRLAGELGLSSSTTIVHGDAFDRESLATLTPRPTVGIASGLFELFPDNEPVLRSLKGMADAIASGGYLIYTCQPWHPQVEFIARVLRNREGRPWIMRRRTQAEMDALVREAGFRKVRQEIDQWGIFSVSIAQRI